MTLDIKPDHEKAVWKRDKDGKMIPVARPQDLESHGKRGDMCKNWGHGFDKGEVGPKKCGCKDRA